MLRAGRGLGNSLRLTSKVKVKRGLKSTPYYSWSPRTLVNGLYKTHVISRRAIHCTHDNKASVLGVSGDVRNIRCIFSEAINSH